ncbi:flagellar basal-body rod protein FlgB [Arcobacter nitrofigilis DSM 7299]|uniref:Flagellar basal body rod protein FlgB n=1 Tax=Arcobacter nitrofigilis (strain ATCC 33309 / DSM 7299 / CCUG 15893 / LMG 7604 / NCTC 12251 / CI) TaxID=572480 RepID=D5V682_ARCNC|nr:flagellar basal body rod protein FlgB [Arcobacter nitrofigilis]ADG94152.1 flagellar basal-body rod protein FlgB [Arcobacter nitrofigilis DSM 7299]
MKPSNVSELLFNTLSYRAERQKVISSNIANINTPDYKTKDLSFESQLQEKNRQKDLQLITTNQNHIKSKENNDKNPRMEVYEVENLQEQNDGNNVNLDTQMSEMAKNNTMFQAIQGSIRKDVTFFTSVIDASAKN